MFHVVAPSSGYRPSGYRPDEEAQVAAKRRAVVFDMDGTLIDSVDQHAGSWQETFRHFGIDVSFEAVRGQIGKGGDQLMPVFVDRDTLERRGKEIESFRQDLFKRKYLPTVKPFPGVRELFERLKADGVTVALASSAKPDELETYKEIAGIADLLDTETSSGDAEKSKPHPDIFQAALDRLHGIDRNDVVVVGDSPYDAIAAGKIELRTVGVLCGGFPEAELRRAGCIAIYRDPEDLLEHYADSPLVGAMVG
jgi:HAD superfamily hydrolase (TIGR01509 family)